MSLETPKPEQMNVSPEQQVVTDLSVMVSDALTAQGVVANILEDGSQVRKVEVAPHFGPTLTEITTPDGTRHYEKTTFFSQSYDRGLMTWQWQEGSSSVNYTGRMEIAGDSSQAIEDEMGIQKVRRDVEYVVSQLPEKPARQKGRFGRTLGKLATRR